MPKGKGNKNKALVMYGATDSSSHGFSSDILWRTRFPAVPEEMLLIEAKGRKYLFVSELEFGRAQKYAEVDRVILIDRYKRRSMDNVIKEFLKEHSIKSVEVPEDFPYALGFALSSKGIGIDIRKGVIYPDRKIKDSWEIKEISKAESATEDAFLTARKVISKSVIRNGKIYSGGVVVTSEFVRKIIEDRLYHLGYLAENTIVAGGIQAADPHLKGSGPLPAKQPIVMDIFPRSISTHYCGDFTRTIFKGMPSLKLQNMYQTVYSAQMMAIKMLKDGTDGMAVHQAVVDHFTKAGYPTRETSSGTEGYFHSTGHGIGIDVHERPIISVSKDILKKNNVVAIEPGLYYHRADGSIPVGGIRIEDLLVITDKGSRNLTRTPKDLRSAILK